MTEYLEAAPKCEQTSFFDTFCFSSSNLLMMLLTFTGMTVKQVLYLNMATKTLRTTNGLVIT